MTGMSKTGHWCEPFLHRVVMSFDSSPSKKFTERKLVFCCAKEERRINFQTLPNFSCRNVNFPENFCLFYMEFFCEFYFQSDSLFLKKSRTNIRNLSQNEIFYPRNVGILQPLVQRSSSVVFGSCARLALYDDYLNIRYFSRGWTP